MRTDIAAPTDSTLTSRAGITATLYLDGSPRDLIVGTPGLSTRDLSPYAESVDITDNGGTIRLAYQNAEFSGALRPRIGSLVSIDAPAYRHFAAIVDSISGEREMRSRGRELTLNLRTRDSMPFWRETRRIGQAATVGMDLGAMARGAGALLNLSADEMQLDDTGIVLAHGQSQLADQPVWQMLESILQVALSEPYVDARGVLKAISRDVRRQPDLTLTADQVVDISSGKNRPPLSQLRVSWLDPRLVEVAQQVQRLAQAQLTAGFFKPSHSVDVTWAEGGHIDGRTHQAQRARNTFLRVIDSINDGLVNLGTESYEQTSEFGGRVSAAMSAESYVADLIIGSAGLALPLLVEYLALPDGVQCVPISGVGSTQPWTNILWRASLFGILMLFTHIGTGQYEVWGQPFDFVEVVNETEAYDINAPEWMQKTVELHNDLVPNEDVADALAVGELIYQARAASKTNLTIADDPRIERGDLLELADGRVYYVTGWSRPLTRGSEALLHLDGFFV